MKEDMKNRLSLVAEIKLQGLQVVAKLGDSGDLKIVKDDQNIS